MDLLEKLNPQQRQSVTAGSGPILVVAGPGSGKTRVLTQRIAYLIAEQGVRPWQILAVTFTNKAAREMRSRVEAVLGEQATEGMMLGTFHSICARLMRREAALLPLESNFVIYDTDDQERIVKTVIRELNINEKLYRPGSVHAAISKAKNDLMGPDDYPTNSYRDEVVKRVYVEYQKRLLACNAVDFDDMLLYTARLLEENPAVRDKYAQRFQHVLVDEFQDTNLAQYALVRHLASHHRNLFCVGDPDQCFPAGTPICTPTGMKTIEAVCAGDQVLAASGRGSTLASRVAHTGKRYYEGELVRVVTRSGRCFEATPNHIVFALGKIPGTARSMPVDTEQHMTGDTAMQAVLTAQNGLALPMSFKLLPTARLHASMILAVEDNGNIVEDEITEVSRVPYRGEVHDFEVENLHNYLAGGIVVHNSIYRWRGADYRNIQRFEQDFPDAQVVLLEQNYRSRQTILDAAMGVINRAQNRRRKNLFSHLGKGEKVFFYEAPDDYAEASFVVDTIAQLVASRQFEPGECAVMYRTNAMSRLVEEAFLQARLPYKLVGAQRFYGRREVKDMIAFLRLVHNPQDEASLDRILNVPPRGIGEKTLNTLHEVARKANSSPGAVLMDLARGSSSKYWASFSGRAVLPLADFGGMLANWRAAAGTLTVVELFDRILTDLGYKAYIDDESEEGIDRWENVQELRRLAVEFSTRTLDEFLENVALVADQDTLTDANAPTLLTFHAAKGLEFGAVFLIGLDDGILPHSRSFDEPEEMEEERRLLYVGITRAKERLYLLRAIRRGGRGMAEDTYPSRFLDDIPAELISGKTRTGSRLRGAPAETRWSLHPRPETAPLVEAQFRAGMRISHPTWGEGMVINSRVEDDDEIVDVVFETVGIKRLAASLANLKIL